MRALPICHAYTPVIADKHPGLAEIGEQLQRFYAAFQQTKLEKSVCDYDDLLEHWLRVLQKDEPVRTHYQQRFRQILVDEYQDTNKLQSDIVDLIAGNHQIMAVGDDAQCIYTFRGANFDNIRRFPERHPDAQIFKIEINYRSTPEILRFANGILDHQHIAKDFHKHLCADRPSNRKPVVVIAARDTKHQAQLVLMRIRVLHEKEGVPLRDIAVLYRAHYQAMDLQIELSRAGLPFTITSGVRFFEQAHVRDLVAHLRFAHNPRDILVFIRLASLLPKVGARKAESVLIAALDCARIQGKTLIDVLTDDAVVAKLPAEARGDFKNLALILQKLAVALAQTGAAPLHPGKRLPPGEIDTQVSHFDDDFSQAPPASSPLPAPPVKPDPVPQPPSPSVTTIHQAKGLEFPVVFLIGAADGLLPLQRAIEEGNVEEERRLFYVASTRAKDELVVLYPRIVTQGGPPAVLEPSRFLNELDPDSYGLFNLSGMQ